MTKPWIQNVSMANVLKGHHFFEEYKTVLIQIQDYGTNNFVEPKYKDKFVEIYQLAFDDHDDSNLQSSIQDTQAETIAQVLRNCLNTGKNIVVHCHAGICRSGAVAEVGVMLGFQDGESFRKPNILVKNLLREKLGLTTDYESIFANMPIDYE